MGYQAPITEQIRQSSDIVDVVGRFVTLRRAGKVFKALCPFHAEKTPSFIVSPDRQIFKCFGCGAGGDVFKFIQLRENLNFSEAKRLLADWAGIPLANEAEPGTTSPRTRIARMNDWAAGVFAKHLNDPAVGSEARAYLEQRRFIPQTWRDFRLGLAPKRSDALLAAARQAGLPTADLQAAGLIRLNANGQAYDTFRDRLMFPIEDVTGRVIGFGGRALGDDPAKYINTAETALFSKGRCLYGLKHARGAMGQSRRAVVVEGYTDCLIAHQSGLRDVVATLGTAFTDEHGQLLRRYVDSVVLVFDGDEAGQAAAGRALEVALGCRLDVRIAILPDGRDPYDLLARGGREALCEHLNSSTPALEFVWEQIERACRQANKPGVRREAIDRFLELVFALSAKRSLDEIDRGELLGRVGRLVALSPQEVHRYAARLQARRARPSTTVTTGPRSDAASSALDDQEQTLLREILEVLLCEPGLYARAREDWSPETFCDVHLRQLARAFVDCVAESGRASITDLTARLQEPAAASLALKLEELGNRRGAFQLRMDEALRRLQKIRAHREVRRQATGQKASPGAPSLKGDEILRRLSAACGESHDFIPMRAVSTSDNS